MARLLKIQDQENPIPGDRLYYRIGEVSRITGLKPHVLRYWESEFKVIRPYKAGSLQRLYRKKDLELIQKIKKLLYEEGYTIAGARKKLGMDGSSDEAAALEAQDDQGPDALALLEVQEEVRSSLTEILSIMESTDRHLKKS